ncbi:hydrogenase nickel incorporation protein HypA [Candidatus Caldarchaeum subterraneum]|uniref:Hydrogenase nickel incorporation protein HypA n=1 Tax=Caldiarchaeum subterraneum TaxID=311458 RepID=E6N710_CALS0|nr:hydrogenase nickel incorporation protein HypA [Candidatus Caldarchaeum subterraneum]BAJ50869.1 hydrogenase nickel incorporation protein HypA [Candidatus Caldarchaeum subterraneum]
MDGDDALCHMHEYVVAVGVVDSLQNFSRSSGRRVKSFRVFVGELSMLNLEVLREALEKLIRQSEVADAVFSVEVERARVICGSCGYVMSFGEVVEDLDDQEKEVIHFLPELIASYGACRICGSKDLRIESGRGVSVRDVVYV